jgi:hypothetical protein
MLLNKLSLAGNYSIIPGQGEFGYSDIPAGDGKNDKLYLQCPFRELGNENVTLFTKCYCRRFL